MFSGKGGPRIVVLGAIQEKHAERLLRTVIAPLVVVLWMVSACSGFGSSLPEEAEFSGIEAYLFRGPSHCDWDHTWFVSMPSNPFGVETDGNVPVYVRDPDKVPQFTYATESDLGADLPSAAEKIGELSKAYELWFDRADQSLIYLVSDDNVEAWALATDFRGCI